MLVSVPECDVGSLRFATLYDYTNVHSCYSRTGRAFRLGAAIGEGSQMYQRTADGCLPSQAAGQGTFLAQEIQYEDLAAVDAVVESL
jgi:hypothetical protein